MRNRFNLNNLLNQDRKTLYTILSIVLVSVLSLTIVYAALATTLRITGNAEVTASNWDIYLDNVNLYSGSATTTKPTITNKTTATFSTTLTNPGDYYMFTIDVVNNGSIDAMIDSIEKTPTLSETQSKYLNYIVEYQNGESINTKQLVEANSFVRLKVKVEFRKDLVSSDLLKSSETLNLSFTVKYTQADESGTSSVTNDGKIVKIVNGDYDTVGSEICLGNECFYVISSTDDDVTMLAKYNLLVGNKFDDTTGVVSLENPTGIQDKTAIAAYLDSDGKNQVFPWLGVVSYSNTNYWATTINSYPANVYNSYSNLYNYVENYKLYLETIGLTINEARLITYQELIDLGCTSASGYCSDTPNWIYSTTYWTGTANSSTTLWRVGSDGVFSDCYFGDAFARGVRPIITISKSQ